MSQRQIAEILNLPKSSVNSIIQKYRQRGTVEQQPGFGRHRISTIEEHEALVNIVRLNLFTNAINAVTVTNCPAALGRHVRVSEAVVLKITLL
jgi:transposase